MDPDRARQLLAAERHRIERELADVTPREREDELSANDDEIADRATELYDEEYDQGRADDLREELAAVERAEARLADGSYGRSIESGKPIPDGRLEAFPTAERTIKEQERFEAGR
jgi:DnaK suppressor protein